IPEDQHTIGVPEASREPLELRAPGTVADDAEHRLTALKSCEGSEQVRHALAVDQPAYERDGRTPRGPCDCSLIGLCGVQTVHPHAAVDDRHLTTRKAPHESGRG